MDLVVEHLTTPAPKNMISQNNSEKNTTSRKRTKRRRNIKSQRQRLLTYHQRMVEERGYPLSRLQLQTQPHRRSLSTGVTRVTGRRLEEEFVRLVGGSYVPDEAGQVSTVQEQHVEGGVQVRFDTACLDYQSSGGGKGNGEEEGWGVSDMSPNENCSSRTYNNSTLRSSFQLSHNVGVTCSPATHPDFCCWQLQPVWQNVLTPVSVSGRHFCLGCQNWGDIICY